MWLTLKRLPRELFETHQHIEIKGIISGRVHILTTSIQEAPLMRGFAYHLYNVKLTHDILYYLTLVNEL